MSAANFQDSSSLYGFLSCLDSIFHEFKHHEEIENKCIMRVLQGRLSCEQLMSVVKEAHKHTHVPEILSLIKKGFRTAKNKKTLLNRMNYKDTLQKAVEEFQRDYLPHMKHEEEVNIVFWQNRSGRKLTISLVTTITQSQEWETRDNKQR